MRNKSFAIAFMLFASLSTGAVNCDKESSAAFVGQVTNIIHAKDGSVEKHSDMITINKNSFEVSAKIMKSYVGDYQDSSVIVFNLPYEFDKLPFAEGQNMLFVLENKDSLLSNPVCPRLFFHAFKTTDSNWVTDYYSDAGLYREFFELTCTDLRLTDDSSLPIDQYQYRNTSKEETEKYYSIKDKRLIPKKGVPAETVTSFVFERFLTPQCHIIAEKAEAPASVPVDLGLSVYWASCNLGAANPQASGLYYAWGAITEQERYDSPASDSYKDAANTILGESWHIPTKAECEELVSKCDWKWTENDISSGFTITSRVNGNSIFIPTAGYWTDKENQGCGYYWTSTSGYLTDNATCFIFFRKSQRPKDNWHKAEMPKSYGLTIRPVKTKK